MAIDPAFLQIGWGDSFQSAMQGYELGQKISNNSAMLNSAKAAEERKQIEFQQQQKMQEDMYNFSLMPNKTHEDYTNMITRYPKLAEDYKKSWEIMDQGQRQQSLSTAAQVMSAIKMGSPDVAKQILEDQAIAYENSGHKESAFNMRRMGGLIDKNPNSIYSSLGLFGSAVSPDEFASMIDKMGNNVRADQMQPYEINKVVSETSKNNAEANKTNVEAEWIPEVEQSKIDNNTSQIKARENEEKYRQQQLYFEQNKPIGFDVAPDGRKVAIMPDGQAIYVKDQQGQYVTVSSHNKPMTATMQKQLFEADDAITATETVITTLTDALNLNANSYDGKFAISRAKARGNLAGNSEEANNTVLLDNMVTGNALDALKATFGAAPTEGERKILLDLQGSVDLPRQQREAIWKRALSAAQKRLTVNQQKAAAIRDGTYTKSSYNSNFNQNSTNKPSARSFFE